MGLAENNLLGPDADGDWGMTHVGMKRLGCQERVRRVEEEVGAIAIYRIQSAVIYR